MSVMIPMVIIIVTILASSRPQSQVALLDLYFSKASQHLVKPDTPFYLKARSSGRGKG